MAVAAHHVSDVAGLCRAPRVSRAPVREDRRSVPSVLTRALGAAVPDPRPPVGVPQLDGAIPRRRGRARLGHTPVCHHTHRDGSAAVKLWKLGRCHGKSAVSRNEQPGWRCKPLSKEGHNSMSIRITGENTPIHRIDTANSSSDGRVGLARGFPRYLTRFFFCASTTQQASSGQVKNGERSSAVYTNTKKNVSRLTSGQLVVDPRNHAASRDARSREARPAGTPRSLTRFPELRIFPPRMCRPSPIVPRPRRPAAPCRSDRGPREPEASSSTKYVKSLGGVRAPRAVRQLGPSQFCHLKKQYSTTPTVQNLYCTRFDGSEHLERA